MKKPDKRKKRSQADKNEKLDFYPNISNVVSSGECTGLMYSPPLNEDEYESYQDLSDMEVFTRKENNEFKNR